jgi:hypothetical protein
MPTALLVLFLILGLPTLWILTPLVRKLWLFQNGRALEELLLSVGVLIAPCLMLLGFEMYLAFERTGLARPADPGWLTLGLAMGLPLWGMMKLLLLFFEELIKILTRIGRRPWAGEEGWGRPLEGILAYGLLVGAAGLCIPALVMLIQVFYDPNPR